MRDACPVIQRKLPECNTRVRDIRLDLGPAVADGVAKRCPVKSSLKITLAFAGAVAASKTISTARVFIDCPPSPLY
jgi:hypothetical protein